MPSATKDLMDVIDKYLSTRGDDIHPKDCEVIIRLKNFIAAQNAIMDRLIEDRDRYILQRQE